MERSLIVFSKAPDLLGDKIRCHGVVLRRFSIINKRSVRACYCMDLAGCKGDAFQAVILTKTMKFPFVAPDPEQGVPGGVCALSRADQVDFRGHKGRAAVHGQFVQGFRKDLWSHADDGKEDAAGIFVGLRHGSGSGYVVNRRVAISPLWYPV